MLHGSKSLSPVDLKTKSKISFIASLDRRIHHMIWLRIKKQELICKLSREASSIQWPQRGVCPPLGQNNSSLTVLSLRQTVSSSSSGLSSSLLSNAKTPTRH